MVEKKQSKKKIKIRRQINLVFFFAFAIILSTIFFILVLKPIFLNIFFNQNIAKQSSLEQIIKRQFNTESYKQEYFASFYDNFYNLSGVERYSNLYYDSTFSSFSSVPFYELNKYEVDIKDFNAVSNDDYEKLCIENKCLERKEKKLYLNGNLIYLPEFNGSIEFISIDRLDDIFYVSFTILKDNKYQVIFYTYDKYFKEVLRDLKISSDIVAPVGIGGTSDDFLIFYGSSLGPLYRVKNNEYFDSSNILSRRISNSYFRPEIFKVENIDGQSDFYIYSSFGNGPILLKMWDNIGPDNSISGVIDLYKLLNLKVSGIRIIDTKKRDNYNEIILKVDDNDIFYSFIDKGFKDGIEGEIISSQVKNKDVFKFNISSIEKLDIEFDKDSLGSILNLSVKEIIDTVEEKESFKNISYSDDLESMIWTKIDIANPLEAFSGNDIENIRLKLVFPSYDNSFSSPFLNSWTFNYYYTK